MQLIEGPFGDIPAHQPGKVIVAIGPRGSVALNNGTILTWGERKFGNYKSFYSVNISPQDVNIAFQANSANHSVRFDVSINLRAKLLDPVSAVHNNFSDLESIFRNPLQNLVVNSLIQYEVSNINKAREAVASSFNKIEIDSAVSLIDYNFDLRPDAEAEKLLRTIDETFLKISANESIEKQLKSQREAITKRLASTDELRAHWIATRDNIYQEVLNDKLAQSAAEKELEFEILKALIQNGMVEPHDFHERFPDFCAKVFSILTKPDVIQIASQNTQKATKVDSQQNNNESKGN